MCPAVKANGYGHGAVEVSRTVLDSGADMLAVASVEEGIELRNAGITAPILNLQCMLQDQIPEAIPYDLTLTLCSTAFAEELSRQSAAAGKTTKVHLKIDTGMGRIGVQREEAVQFALAVSKLPGLEIEGIFTHLPSADEDDLGFTVGQIGDFHAAADAIVSSGVDLPIRHASNSAAILNLADARFEMVRPGIIVYGLYDAVPKIELHQAMTVKTKVAFLKTLPPGRTVGYGRTFKAERPTVVATVPIGYGDGYNRLLSNKGKMLVHGKRVPVVGRVCMDQTMLDVTDVPDVKLGDEVVVYGAQGDAFIGIDEVASLIGTISYEVTCTLTSRVPRVYVRR
jgi:alanine racemase